MSFFKPSLRNSHPFPDVACNFHPSPKPITVSVRTVPIFTLQTKMAKLFTNFQTTPPKPIPVSGRSVPISKLQTKMAKLCIHLQTKTAPANTIPLGVAHTYIANVCTAAKTLFANVLLLQWCSHANTWLLRQENQRNSLKENTLKNIRRWIWYRHGYMFTIVNNCRVVCLK